MQRPPTPFRSSLRPSWDHLAEYVREHIQEFIQTLLEEEVTELLGRPKSARRKTRPTSVGYRNGHGNGASSTNGHHAAPETNGHGNGPLTAITLLPKAIAPLTAIMAPLRLIVTAMGPPMAILSLIHI